MDGLETAAIGGPLPGPMISLERVSLSSPEQLLPGCFDRPHKPRTWGRCDGDATTEPIRCQCPRDVLLQGGEICMILVSTLLRLQW